MSCVQPEVEPPEIKEGDTVKAKILDIQYPVESKFADDKGNPVQQIRFTIQLENGYQTASWMRYYQRPRKRSRLGALVLTLQSVFGKEYATVSEALDALKRHGWVYAKVPDEEGFFESRETGQLLPKFKIVPTKLPDVPQKQAELPVVPPTQPAKLTMAAVMERTKTWPEDERQEYIRMLQSEGRLAENP